MENLQFKPMNSAELDKEIKSIDKAGNNLNKRIQAVALNALWYVNKHGDIGFANRLMLAMNSGQRRQSMVVFLETHGKLEWNGTDKAFVFRKRDDVNENTVATINEFWYDALKEPPIRSSVDFEDKVHKFIKSLERDINNSKVVVEHSSLYDYMAKAYSEYQADQIALEIAKASDDDVAADETGIQDFDAFEEMETNRQGLRMAA